jgi:hypothetical protein
MIDDRFDLQLLWEGGVSLSEIVRRRGCIGSSFNPTAFHCFGENQ